MMLGCNKTITVYHASFDPKTRSDVWTEQVIHGCSWYSKLQIKPADKGVKAANEFYVRIPLVNAPKELIITKGDYVAKGHVPLKEVSPQKIMEAYKESFGVMSYTVNDDCGAYSKHIRIQGAS